MSQKSSVPQAISFTSQVLKRDNSVEECRKARKYWIYQLPRRALNRLLGGAYFRTKLSCG
jgi:hypothetical protein